MSRICHWVPAYQTIEDARIRPQSCLDVVAAVQAGHYYSAEFADSSDLPAMRNAALEYCREKNFDYLYMQDADVYSPGASAQYGHSPLMHMLAVQQETEAAMVAAVVGLRRFGPNGEKLANVKPFSGAGHYEVDEAGTGMVLISVAHVNDVAAEYAGPWFARSYHDERQSRQDVGLDVWFSRVMRAHGKRVVACAEFPTVHVLRDHRTLHFDPREVGIATAAEPERG